MRKAYPSELTDQQWAILEPLIPANATGRPRIHDVREVLNAIFYLNRVGCQWDMLPHDFPPRSTVFNHFRRWRDDGTWQSILDAVRRQVRKAAGREPNPSVVSIDSQTVKGTEVGGERGYAGGKKLRGVKRRTVVDTLGLLLLIVVSAASADDGTYAPRVLRHLTEEHRGRLELVWADSKYNNRSLDLWMAAEVRYRLEVLGRPPGAVGYVQLPRRWVVEIVRTQMTKTDVLALGAGGEDVADLDLVARDDDAVDQQLHQLTLLIEAGALQAFLDTPAERFQRGREPEQLVETAGLPGEARLLPAEGLDASLDPGAAAPVLRQRDDAAEVGFGQAFELLGQRRLALLQSFTTRLEFLRMPGVGRRASEGLRHHLGVPQQRDQILPDQVVQCSGRGVTRVARLPVAVPSLAGLPRAKVVGVARSSSE